MPKFSPAMVTTIIMEPLKYFFANYAKSSGLFWDPDDKLRTLEISSVNDFNRIRIGAIPRILVTRGTFNIQKTGLSDNLSHSESVSTLRGSSDRYNKVFINGTAAIIIEARNEGTCELIADMVSHFIVWTRPLLCDSMGFKDFGLPMQVSEPEVDKEDIEKFKVTIQFPYTVEEDWRVNQEALQLKGFFIDLGRVHGG
jgi:hypothetical protein